MIYPTDINGTVFNPDLHNLLNGAPELTATGKFRKVRGTNSPENIAAFKAAIGDKAEPVAVYEDVAEPEEPAKQPKPLVEGIDVHSVGSRVGADVEVQNDTTVIWRKGLVAVCLNPKAFDNEAALVRKLAEGGIR